MSAKTFDIADLYVSEQRRLRQLIRRLVGNRATTEDLVQQTFTKLLSAADTSNFDNCPAYLAESGPGRASWLAGLADLKLARYAKLPNNVAADWSGASIASAASMSRSSFAAKFKSVVGGAPLDYVTRWRMQRAPNID